MLKNPNPFYFRYSYRTVEYHNPGSPVIGDIEYIRKTQILINLHMWHCKQVKVTKSSVEKRTYNFGYSEAPRRGAGEAPVVQLRRAGQVSRLRTRLAYDTAGPGAVAHDAPSQLKETL